MYHTHRCLGGCRNKSRAVESMTSPTIGFETTGVGHGDVAYGGMDMDDGREGVAGMDDGLNEVVACVEEILEVGGVNICLNRIDEPDRLDIPLVALNPY